MGLTHTALVPADLMQMPPPENGRQYELSDGELIIVGSAGARHERIKSRVVTMLVLWQVKNALGRVFSESMFTLGEQTARIPDAAVILTKKIAELPDADVPIPFSPDLAVEVISVSESARDAEKKVNEYLAAGTAEVWQVYPEERRVRVRRPSIIRDYETADILTSDVLKGFETRVERFFFD